MAIYHLNVRYCSKSKGQSAQAKNDYINRNDKYSKRSDDLQFSGYGNMPSFAENDPEKFWKSSDVYERSNARVCTEIEFALPRELTLKQQAELVDTFIKKTVDTAQNKLPYSFAIHNDKDGNNPHCHLIFSERQLDGIERTEEQFFKRANSKNPALGGTKKTADFRDRDFIKSVRQTWREQANIFLDMYGHQERIDERSYQEQGIDKEPRSRLDRVTWNELKALEKNSENLEREIAKTGKEIEQEKRYEELKSQGMGGFQARFNSILGNVSKTHGEQQKQKAEQSQSDVSKNAENRKQEITQIEFDKFLISHWLEPAETLERNEKKLADLKTEYDKHASNLKGIKSEYDQLNERNQGFLGLWESKEQKQRKQELENEYNRELDLRNKAKENHNDLYDKIQKFKAVKIEPLQKQIEQMRADNPDLKMRNSTQLQSMQFKGIDEWHKESRQRKIEWERFEQKRQQERKSGLSL